MADKQLKYEIQADVKGRESITGLADDLDDVAKVLKGEVGQQAQAAAAHLRELAQQDAAITAFSRLQAEVRASTSALKAADTEAANYARQIAAMGPPTAQEAAALQRLQAAADGTRATLGQQQQALSVAKAELQSYGIAGQNAQAAQQRLRQEVTLVRDAVKDLVPAYQGAATGAQSAGSSMVRTHRQIGDGVESISQQLSRLQSFYAALTGLQGFKAMATDLAETADQVSNLQSGIKLVTGEGAIFASSWEGVKKVALDTNSALEETGTLFARLTQAGKDAGLSTADATAQALAMTETINQSIQLSGASAEASKASITQLIQGLQSGVLRGDEFNSVMEQSPRLARALADGLKVTTGELRAQAEQGRLTSDVVIKALQSQSSTVAAEFSKLPPTVGRALQNLSTQWALYVGESDKATGASTVAAGAINLLAGNLKTIAGYLIDAGQAGAAFVALRLAQHFIGLGAAAQQAAVQVAANTAAVNAAGAAGATAAVGVGRFATILASLKTFTLLGIITNFHDIGTAIGEGIARLAGYKDKSEEIARADKLSNEIAQQGVQIRRDQAAALQAAIDKSFGLTKAGSELVAQFEEMRKKGDSADEAIKKIGKDFDLKSVPGIADAAGVLDKLVNDGKISAGQFREAWEDAIKGLDLGVLEVNARAAFAGTSREAERLAQVLDATLREAIRRSGLEFDVISGGMGKASRSAINDTDAMIAGLDRLKAQGVDVERALTASIGKGLDTADSQKAIEAVRQQIESLRNVLGDKLTDGLLDQAKAKANELSDALDKAKPGINSLREAMAELGLKSREDLQRTADKAREAYGVMIASGQSEGESYLAWQTRKTNAAAVMLTRMLEANGGVRDAAIESRAAMEGLELQTDRTGKTIVRAMGEGEQGVGGLGDAVRQTTEQIRAQEDAMDRIEMRYKLSADYTERQIALLEREAAAIEKAAAAELKRLNIDKEKYSLDASGKRIEQLVQTRASVAATLEDKGVSQTTAESLAARIVDAVGNLNLKGSGVYQEYDTLSTVLDKLAKKYATPGAATGSSGSSTATQTYTVNLNINGHNTAVNVSSQADATALVQALKSAGANSGLL